MTPVYRYRAELLRVIDGDTYLLDVDLGFHVHANQTIRLRGVNCPEMSTPAGKYAKGYVRGLFAATDELVVETYRDKQTFARWVADVWLDGFPLAATIIAADQGKEDLTRR